MAAQAPACEFAGTVTSASDDSSQVALLLLRRNELAGWQSEQGWIRQGEGNYSCTTGTGHFVIIAWEDHNRDSAWQPTENIGWYGSDNEPAIIVCNSASSYEALHIELREPSPLIRSVVSSYAEQVGKGSLQLPGTDAGEVVTASDSRLRTEHASLGMWKPEEFMGQGLDGLYFLEPYSPDKIPVLFVHGINGSGSDWLELLPSLDRSRFQPWLLQYASGERLPLVANRMHQTLGRLQAQHGFEELFLVAHSMGGLVAREAINRCLQHGNDWVRMFATLSTPFDGLEIARSGIAYSPTIVPAWLDMVPDSVFLETLFEQQLPASLEHHLIFSFQGNGDDGVVTVRSQLRPEAQQGATSRHGFFQDHGGILRDGDCMDWLSRALNEAATRLGR